MNLKKDKKITAILLALIMVVIPFGKSINAYQGSMSSNYIRKSIEDTLGDSENLKQDLESKPELLESYELEIEDIERLESEREDFGMDSDISDLFSEEQIKLMKLEFQNTNGTEDVFKVIYKLDNMVCEVNGAKGIMRTTIYDSNGNVENTYDVNYFDALDNLKDNALTLDAESRASTIVPSKAYGSGTVASVFSPRIKVTRDTRDRITITSTSKTRTKSYSKAKYNWNSGNTKVFYDAINSARSQWSTIGYSLNSALLGKLIGYVSGLIASTSFAPQVSAVVAFLGSIGIVGTSAFVIAQQVISFLGSMLKISNTYKKI